jgi:methionyl-tRNA formyltransferase
MVEKKNMKMLFFGTSGFAVESLKSILKQSQISLCGVVTQPDRRQGRGQQVSSNPVKQYCVEQDLVCFQPEKLSEFKNTIHALEPEVGWVVAYGKILPTWLFDEASYFSKGLFNVHASLLPRHRGASPIHYALMCGDENTGLCLQKMVPELDAGPIWLQNSVSVLPQDNFGTLELRLKQLLPELTQNFASQFPPSPQSFLQQDKARVTHAPKITAPQRQFDLNLGLPNWIVMRAFLPTPGIWITQGQQQLFKICELEYVSKNRIGLPPFTIKNSAVLFLNCLEGHYLQVTCLQMPGKSKQTTQAWANGHQKLIKELSEAKLLTIE